MTQIEITPFKFASGVPKQVFQVRKLKHFKLLSKIQIKLTKRQKMAATLSSLTKI